MTLKENLFILLFVRLNAEADQMTMLEPIFPAKGSEAIPATEEDRDLRMVFAGNPRWSVNAQTKRPTKSSCFVLPTGFAPAY